MLPKDLWIAALRSGYYQWNREFLDDAGYISCLGVACHVYLQNRGQLALSRVNGILYFDGQSRALPKSVQQWLGLRNKIGKYGKGQSLLQDNDSGISFRDIANIIESEPEGLFVSE